MMTAMAVTNAPMIGAAAGAYGFPWWGGVIVSRPVCSRNAEESPVNAIQNVPLSRHGFIGVRREAHRERRTRRGHCLRSNFLPNNGEQWRTIVNRQAVTGRRAMRSGRPAANAGFSTQPRDLPANGAGREAGRERRTVRGHWLRGNISCRAIPGNSGQASGDWAAVARVRAAVFGTGTLGIHGEPKKRP